MGALFLYLDSTKSASPKRKKKRNDDQRASAGPSHSYCSSWLREAVETIWRQVNMAIVKSSLRFTTIIHENFKFSLKKALLPWNFKCRGDKRLVACWRPVLKFWSPTPKFWSHWRPVSRNFGPWSQSTKREKKAAVI